MARKLSLVLLILGIATASAYADIYVGASAGQMSLEASDSSFDFSNDATAYKIYGGWGMKFFGIEASYVDLGSPSDSDGGVDVEVDTTAYDAFVKGNLPIGKHFEIFGKAGIVYWNADTNVSGSGSESDSGNDMVYGAGVAFKFGEHLAVRGEYERFDISEVDSLYMASVGADFRF